MILQPFALSSFMFNFVKGERGAGYNISGDLNTCVYFEDTGSEKRKNRIYKKQPANMTALMQMQRRYDTMFMCAHMHPRKR